MKFTPHAYQKKAIKFVVSRACAALFLDPGLGKTSIMYGAFKVLKELGMVERMLVIAPLRPALSVWPGEQRKWDDFADLRVQVLHGDDKDAQLSADMDVDVINPEGLPWLFAEVRRRRMEWPWQMLVVDESTRFKHTQTRRFHELKPHLTKFRRRYALTGSPAPNGLLDLFGQVFILDMGNALGRFITHYRMKFFDATGYGGYTWKPKTTAEPAIYKRLGPLVLRMAAEDYLKLPPLVNNTIRVELPDKARKAYTTMEKLLLSVLEDETVTAANLAAAANKCRQIANGGIYREGGETWMHVHDAKTEVVEELVEGLQGKPALIAYEYRHDLARLKGAFGKDTPHLGGGVTAKEQARIEAAWNAGDIPVLLAQPKSVAHGLNLQGVGAAVIWHSLSYDLEEYEQFVRRIWRQGQKDRVVVHHIVATDTVDEAIMAALAGKDRTQRRLLDALKAYGRRRKNQ